MIRTNLGEELKERDQLFFCHPITGMVTECRVLEIEGNRIRISRGREELEFFQDGYWEKEGTFLFSTSPLRARLLAIEDLFRRIREINRIKNGGKEIDELCDWGITTVFEGM